MPLALSEEERRKRSFLRSASMELSTRSNESCCKLLARLSFLLFLLLLVLASKAISDISSVSSGNKSSVMPEDRGERLVTHMT